MLPRKRYIEPSVRKDLSRNKMVFIGGPRQVGKTTFATGLLPSEHERTHGYLNWDDVRVRKALTAGHLPEGLSWVVLDEIHKFRRWRSLVKGMYDTHKGKVRFLVTGSARLDRYRRGGDSLQGRYHYYRLHPFSYNELKGTEYSLQDLLQFGGFPEPLSAKDIVEHRRWQKERHARVIYGDIRDLENVRNLSLLEVLVNTLPSRVGAPLSVKNIAQDLEVSFRTADNWISILERMYVGFRISPYGATKIRAVKKEKKWYFADWSVLSDGGPQFENLVACQLLKYCHFTEDSLGHSMELRFLRDTDKREIDFVVLKDGRPEFAVECKTGERHVSPHIAYFRARTPIPRYFQVHLGKAAFVDQKTGAEVLPFGKWCEKMKFP